MTSAHALPRENGFLGFKPAGPSRPSRPSPGARSRPGGAPAAKGSPVKNWAIGLGVMAVVIIGLYLLFKPAPGAVPSDTALRFMEARKAENWEALTKLFSAETAYYVQQSGVTPAMFGELAELLIPKGEYKLGAMEWTKGKRNARVRVTVTRPNGQRKVVDFRLVKEDTMSESGKPVTAWRVNMTNELNGLAGQVQLLLQRGGAR